VVKLFSRDLGGSGRPPLIVLHGLLGSSRNWLSAGAALGEHWHVHGLDQRNHGQSPHTGDMNYELLVGDVLAWMDQQGLDAVDLMGHSMGGKVAMVLACRHPQRVRRLMVVDIAPRSYRSEEARAEFVAMHALNPAGLKSRTEAEQQMEALVPSWAMRKFLTTNLERAAGGGFRWVINLPVIADALPALEDNPITAVDDFDGPSLFVVGGKSRYVTADDHLGIRKHFPSSTLHVMPESGHNPHMQSRDAFVQVVADWAASTG